MQQLGRSSSELFASIEREALASASVAQVHRCTLKDGRQAVIKVCPACGYISPEYRRSRFLRQWVDYRPKIYDLDDT